MKEKLIAPCGMNCALCMAYIGKKIDINKKGFKRMYCEGCIPRGKNCLHMAKSCELLKNGEVRFCFECENYPCKRLKALDKRYRTKYHLSMIENLELYKTAWDEGFSRERGEQMELPGLRKRYLLPQRAVHGMPFGCFERKQEVSLG